MYVYECNVTESLIANKNCFFEHIILAYIHTYIHNYMVHGSKYYSDMGMLAHAYRICERRVGK